MNIGICSSFQKTDIEHHLKSLSVESESKSERERAKSRVCANRLKRLVANAVVLLSRPRQKMIMMLWM